MSERAKKQREELAADSDKQFLEKNGVKEIVRNILNDLISNRPTDPLAFIADYFHSSTEPVNPVEECYQMLSLTHHSRSAFERNLAAAFNSLNETKGPNEISGINGSIFNELLGLLLKDFPDPIAAKVKEKVAYRPHEAVSYEAFRYGIYFTLIMKDFQSQALQLFHVMDTTESGSVDKIYSEALLSKLKGTFSVTDKSPRVLEACFDLAPNQIHNLLAQASSPSHNRASINKEQFLELSAHTFLLSSGS